MKRYEDAYTADRAQLVSSTPELLAAYDAAVSAEQVEQAADAIVERLTGPPDLDTDAYDAEAAHEQWLIEYAEQTGITHFETLEERLNTAPTADRPGTSDGAPEYLWRATCAHVASQTVDEHWPAVEAALHRVQDAGRDPNALLRQALAATPEHDEHPGRNLHYRLIARDDAAATPRVPQTTAPGPVLVTGAEAAMPRALPPSGPRR